MKRLTFFALVLLAFAFACGKTVFSGERFACSSAGDCADGFECRGQECVRPGTEPEDGGSDAGFGDAGPPDGGNSDAGAMDAGGGDAGAGTTCSTSVICRPGLTCADGVCCLTACNAPCDSCNQAGSEGTCLPKAAGSIAPTCGGYACNGTSTACASSCAASDGCNPGFSCVAPTCGRCWSAVTDDFSVMNDPAWTLSGATINTGHLVVSVLSRNGMPSQAAATSVDTLPLSGCGVTFELPVPPVPVAGYLGRAELRADTIARLPSFAWLLDTRGLSVAWAFSDGGVGEQVVVPAGTAVPRWLRIEESAGSVRWRAASSTTFTTLKTLTQGEPLTGMKLEFTGNFPAQPGSDRVTFEVDSLNLGH